ncbi:hypothetical protein NFI96_028145 [Prochilodus magdalenae]|nr:hypothetical protein NFI96_028145 [Prochilodus magdalenae]
MQRQIEQRAASDRVACSARSSSVQRFLPRSLTMAIPDNRALQHLAAELARLDQQISALLKKQNELLQMKSQLKASRGVSRSPASSSAASEVSPSVLAPRPHKEFGNASTAEGLPDSLLHPSHPSPTTTGSLHSARRQLQHQFLGPRRPLQRLGPPHRTHLSLVVLLSAMLDEMVLEVMRLLPVFQVMRPVACVPRRSATFGTVVIHVGRS